MSVWWDANRYRSTLPHKVLYVWCWPVIRAVMSALPPETAQHLAIRGIKLAAWVERRWGCFVTTAAIFALIAIRLLIVLPWFTCEPPEGES